MHAIAFLTAAIVGLTTFDGLPQETLGASPIVDGQIAVRVALISTSETLVPGATTRVGLHFALSPNWHIYGTNPGSAGFPTSVQWQVKRGTVSMLQFPPPQMFQESDDIFTYGYSGNTLLVAELQADAAGPDPVVLEANVKYLACNVICSPGEVHLRRIWPITEAARDATDAERNAFATADSSTRNATDVEEAQKAKSLMPLSLARALALALLGGLVLNLMPCVLPVLALKAVALLQQSHAPQLRRRHGLFYALGVVASTLTLGIVVMLVRAAGHSVGWGFQFQQPMFIAAVAVMLLLFACNCFGLFDITHGVGRVSFAHDHAQGDKRSILEGILAVLVATPCSAPFLGTAVAFALAQPNIVVAFVFVAIGIGLALPFVLLCFVPGLSRFLPRPGPFMGHLKTLLGFSLLLTCVWLLWLFGRVQGIDEAALLLLILLAAALLSWVLGVVCQGAPSRLPVGLVLLVVSLAVALRLTLSVAPNSAHPETRMAPYSAALVQAELQAGRNVLVDFTADWCITCKYNERHVLQNKEVQQQLNKHHVTVLRADFTQHDADILATLKRHGRAGVPMYLLYTPTTHLEPTLLPELLTVHTLVQALTGL